MNSVSLSEMYNDLSTQKGQESNESKSENLTSPFENEKFFSVLLSML